jgi:hypothetical protein
MDGITGQEWKCTCKLVDWLLVDDILLLELLLWDREIKLELWRRRINFCWPLLPVEKTGLCNTGMQLASKEDRQAAWIYVLTQRQQIFPTDINIADHEPQIHEGNLCAVYITNTNKAVFCNFTYKSSTDRANKQHNTV